MNARSLIVACALALSACGNAGPSSSNRGAAAQASPGASTPTSVGSASTSTTVPAIAAVDAAPLARYDGYGDMRFGMDAAAFGVAWNGALEDTRPQPGSSCFYRRPVWVKQPGDFAFMFEGGRFVRYDAGTPSEIAPGGGRVGMNEAQIRGLYGPRVEEQPHKYIAGANYLRVKSQQGDAVLVFETGADGRVTRWRVGVPPQIDYVEGCA